jgi:hypothetical protein
LGIRYVFNGIIFRIREGFVNKIFGRGLDKVRLAIMILMPHIGTKEIATSACGGLAMTGFGLGGTRDDGFWFGWGLP